MSEQSQQSLTNLLIRVVDEIKRLESENEALKVERDTLAASVLMIKGLADDDVGFMQHLGRRNYDALGNTSELCCRNERVMVEDEA